MNVNQCKRCHANLSHMESEYCILCEGSDEQLTADKVREWMRLIEADRTVEAAIRSCVLDALGTLVNQLDEQGGLERYVGQRVTNKEPIPSDRRGEWIPAGAAFIASELVSAQHFNLTWPDGKRAASQVHFSKLATV